MSTTIEVSRHIAAPIEKVFSVASDFAGAPQVVRAIDKVEMLTPGPVGVGTRFRETRTVFGKQASEEMEVTAFEPPRRYAVGCTGHGCRYHSEFLFEPKQGGTEVKMSFEATPLTFFAKVMSVLMKPMIKSMAKMCEQDLDDIKTAIEGGKRAA